MKETNIIDVFTDPFSGFRSIWGSQIRLRNSIGLSTVEFNCFVKGSRSQANSNRCHIAIFFFKDDQIATGGFEPVKISSFVKMTLFKCYNLFNI